MELTTSKTDDYFMNKSKIDFKDRDARLVLSSYPCGDPVWEYR